MVTDVSSTELDFESIRTSLKNYFAADDQFKDYDFEASGLSNILDVLAYNTHYNALIGNMAINESFLETAQLRSSIVTHALSLGYFPRSRVASRATITLTANLSGFVGTRPATITLPAGTKFNASVEGVTYVFQSRGAWTGTDNGSGIYTFKDTSGSSNLTIYEGTSVTRTFYVPEASEKRIYVITDAKMDTETADVRVFANRSTTSYTSYSHIQDAIRIDSTSTYYLLKEAPNGYYELQFGDGTMTGLAPEAGNKITVEYLSTNGALANGARTFTPQSGITVEGQSFSLTATRVAVSNNGSDKQTSESIRLNAPLGYASQKRMVTTSDYYTQISSSYPTLQDVIAWGGEENTPVDYGKIFISIKYPDDTDSDTQTSIQNGIVNDLITPLATMSITPEFVEPIDVYLGLATTFDFNPNKTSLSLEATANAIINAKGNYFTDNLEKFGKIFRRSNLLSIIDDLNEAILSSAMTVTMNQRITPTLGVDKAYTVQFPVSIATADDVFYRITSSRFVYNSNICTIKNKLGSTQLQIVNESGVVIQSNIGSYDTGLGKVQIDSLNPTSIQGGVSYIKIIVAPASQSTIRPLKNYILNLDDGETTARGNIDYQNQRTSV